LATVWTDRSSDPYKGKRLLVLHPTYSVGTGFIAAGRKVDSFPSNSKAPPVFLHGVNRHTFTFTMSVSTAGMRCAFW
jgi:hypothetical protein